MKKSEVLALCQAAGTKYNIDPLLLCAICEQESSFVHDAVRLENGFYLKYSRPMKYSTPVEVLLSASYGLMQTMGESLREMELLQADDSVAVVKMIDAYIKDPALQVDCGARWFARKLKLAGGNEQKGLRYWNGDMGGRYAAEVLARRDRLKTEATK